MPKLLVKHYFWVCLWGCFQEISICISAPVKKQMQVLSLNADGHLALRAWINKKVEEGWICSLLELEHPSSALGHQHCWVPANTTQTGTSAGAALVLRPLELDWNYTTSFPGLQLADAYHGASQLPSSCKPIPHNKPRSIHLCVAYWLLVWRPLFNARVNMPWFFGTQLACTAVRQALTQFSRVPAFIWSNKASFIHCDLLWLLLGAIASTKLLGQFWLKTGHSVDLRLIFLDFHWIKITKLQDYCEEVTNP